MRPINFVGTGRLGLYGADKPHGIRHVGVAKEKPGFPARIARWLNLPWPRGNTRVRRLRRRSSRNCRHRRIFCGNWAIWKSKWMQETRWIRPLSAGFRHTWQKAIMDKPDFDGGPGMHLQDVCPVFCLFMGPWASETPAIPLITQTATTAIAYYAFIQGRKG